MNSADKCPRCQKESRLICDNTCGTLVCEYCHLEWYFTSKEGVLHRLIGHAPNCGED